MIFCQFYSSQNCKWEIKWSYHYFWDHHPSNRFYVSLFVSSKYVRVKNRVKILWNIQKAFAVFSLKWKRQCYQKFNKELLLSFDAVLITIQSCLFIFFLKDWYIYTFTAIVRGIFVCEFVHLRLKYVFLYDRKNCPNCLTSGVVSGCSQRSILMIVYHGHEVVVTSSKNIMHIVYILWTFYKINAKIGFWPKFCGSLCKWGMVSQIHIIFFYQNFCI